MKLPTLAVVFDRKHNASTTKEGVVEIRISHNYKTKYMSTSVKVLPRFWKNNRVTGRVDANVLQAKIDALMHNVNIVIGHMIEENSIDIQEIPSRLERLQHANMSFIEYCDERAIVHKNGISEDSQERYDRFLRFFKQWGKIKYFPDITDMKIIEMDEELKKKNLKPVSAWNNYHRFLNTFIIDAIDDGYIKKNPYKRIKLDKGKNKESLEKKKLELEEFIALRDTEMPTNYIAKARDLFLLQTYTCLSYCDLMDFDTGNIKKDNSGRMYYTGYRGKTDVKYTFLVLPQAMEIIEKFNREIPQISNQKYNCYLKMAAQMAGIKKRISSHWARHTGATILLNLGISEEIVARVLGHKTTKITREVYASLNDETVAEQMEKAIEKY